MITAVDTSVLLDIFRPDPRFADRSAAALGSADESGSLVICDVVYAELASQFARRETLDSALARLDIRVEPLDREISFSAGRAFLLYRQGGGTKVRILPDFLIAAHAQLRASRLLTRDRGFYRTHFGKLTVFDPTEG